MLGTMQPFLEAGLWHFSHSNFLTQNDLRNTESGVCKAWGCMQQQEGKALRCCHRVKKFYTYPYYSIRLWSNKLLEHTIQYFNTAYMMSQASSVIINHALHYFLDVIEVIGGSDFHNSEI